MLSTCVNFITVFAGVRTSFNESNNPLPVVAANSGMSVNICENLSKVSAKISKSGAAIIIAIAPDPPTYEVCPKILGLPGAILLLTGFLAAL